MMEPWLRSRRLEKPRKRNSEGLSDSNQSVHPRPMAARLEPRVVWGCHARGRRDFSGTATGSKAQRANRRTYRVFDLCGLHPRAILRLALVEHEIRREAGGPSVREDDDDSVPILVQLDHHHPPRFVEPPKRHAIARASLERDNEFPPHRVKVGQLEFQAARTFPEVIDPLFRVGDDSKFALELVCDVSEAGRCGAHEFASVVVDAGRFAASSSLTTSAYFDSQ